MIQPATSTATAMTFAAAAPRVGWRVTLRRWIAARWQEEIDRIFHAVADSTRRDIVNLVLQGEHSVSELARRLDLGKSTVHRALQTLEALVALFALGVSGSEGSRTGNSEKTGDDDGKQFTHY